MGMKDLALLGVMMGIVGAGNNTEFRHSPSIAPKPKRKIIPKGLKEFIYGENIVYALNKKNADKKALSKGYCIN